MLTIPKVNGSIEAHSGFFQLRNRFLLHSGGFDLKHAQVFLERVKEAFQLEGDISDSRAADIALIKEAGGPSEAYALEITAGGIRLYASEDAGMVWALTTLYQMLAEAHKHRDSKLPAASLQDWPKYAHRGLLVDVSRHFFDITEMKKVIEEMSLHKLNVLHWHLTDDQGWRIESKVHPRLHEIGSSGQFYTQDEIREIVDYADRRGIEIIPELDMPGHATAAISAYPHLSCFDENVLPAVQPGIFKVIMCAGKESTYKWIYELLDEMAELFPSRRIHLGGDEAPKDKWKACPHCNALKEASQVETYEDLQGIFTLKIADYLASKGKEAICWNETLKSKTLTDKITAQYWMEMSPESYVYPRFQAGQPMIFSEVFHLYFDYPYAIVPLRKTYEYEPGILQHRKLGGDNVLGIEGAIWTERVPTADILEAMISPRIQALSEAAWTIERDYGDFAARLKEHLEHLGVSQLTSTPLEQAMIDGEEAKQQAHAFLQAFVGMMSNPDIEMGLSKEEIKGMAAFFISNILDEAAAEEWLKSLEL